MPGLDSLLAIGLIAAFGLLRMLVVGIEVEARQRAAAEEDESICCVGKEEDCE